MPVPTKLRNKKRQSLLRERGRSEEKVGPSRDRGSSLLRPVLPKSLQFALSSLVAPSLRPSDKCRCGWRVIYHDKLLRRQVPQSIRDCARA
jgi:hypothetical protein